MWGSDSLQTCPQVCCFFRSPTSVPVPTQIVSLPNSACVGVSPGDHQSRQQQLQNCPSEFPFFKHGQMFQYGRSVWSVAQHCPWFSLLSESKELQYSVSFSPFSIFPFFTFFPRCYSPASASINRNHVARRCLQSTI